MGRTDDRDITSRVKVRPAGEPDLAEIAGIYNEAVLNTTATFDASPKTLEEKEKWMAGHGPEHPILVAVLDGEVAGWASLSPHNDRCCYRTTVEDSLYVRRDLRGLGIGRRLLSELLNQAGSLGHHAVIARIDGENAASLRIHRDLGFVEVGRLRDVGFKFGRWLDVILMEIILRPGPSSTP